MYFEKGWSPKKLYASLPSVILQIESKLKLIDDILEDSKNIISNKLSYADISVGYLLWFIRGRWKNGPNILGKYKNLLRLEADINSLNDKHGYKNMTDIEALKLAYETNPMSPIGINSNISTDLKVGHNVKIKPAVESSDPTVSGNLRYLDSSTVAINHHSDETGNIAIHFPVSGYEILKSE